LFGICSLSDSKELELDGGNCGELIYLMASEDFYTCVFKYIWFWSHKLLLKLYL